MSTKDNELQPVSALGECITDLSRPIGERMRAVFYLRTHNTIDAALALCKALEIREASCLFRHEVAYALGQMQLKDALPTLTAVLRDTNDDPIVRHECAEAIGAIGDKDSIEVIEEFVHDTQPEVSETCKIALKRLRWAVGDSEGGAHEEATSNPYESIDPAPAASEKLSTDELRSRLLDTKLSLYERYRAMFGLRNQTHEAAVRALADGFTDKSALFRHEVAYVLGQLQHPAATKALMERLVDVSEHEMVRHEAAEALGAIGTEDALKLLHDYQNDSAKIVAESCDVALDAADYWQSSYNENTAVNE